jgi:hypothetical protein
MPGDPAEKPRAAVTPNTGRPLIQQRGVPELLCPRLSGAEAFQMGDEINKPGRSPALVGLVLRIAGE